MSITLVCTWQPRGELPRFQRLYQALMDVFEGIVLIMPPDETAVAEMVNDMTGVRAYASDQWPRGRIAALEHGLEMSSAHLMYCDFDRILHWVELYPSELHAVVAQAQAHEVLVIGRTARAMATHPMCLAHTERIINDVFAHVTGLPWDICVATRCFSRSAAARVVHETQVRTPLGVDGEWLYILKRAGYPMTYVEAEGMEWETADQFLPAAADPQTRERLAAETDASARHWQQRVNVAQQIIGALLAVAQADRGNSRAGSGDV